MSNYASERQADQDFTYRTGNYPPTNDTTSEGGYGSSTTFSPHSQRHADPSQPSSNSSNFSETGLIDQSPDGGPLARELQDAKQGADPRAREQFAHEARRDFASASTPTSSAGAGAAQGQGLNPYGANPDSRAEAGARLAAGYADQRGRQYESGGAASGEGDQSAL